MWQRGLFELVRWPTLSATAQRQAATDIVSGLGASIVDDAGIRLGAVAQQSEEVQAKMGQAVLVGAGASPSQLGVLGFPPNHS